MRCNACQRTLTPRNRMGLASPRGEKEIWFHLRCYPAIYWLYYLKGESQDWIPPERYNPDQCMIRTSFIQDRKREQQRRRQGETKSIDD